MVLEWSSDNFVDYAYEAWQSDIMTDGLPWALGHENKAFFSAYHKIVAINDLTLVQNKISVAQGERTRKEIRSSTTEQYSVAFMTSGETCVRQGDFDRRTTPGQLYFWDSSLDCGFRVDNSSDQIELSIPKHTLHQLSGGQVLPAAIADGTTGTGAMLAQFMVTAMQNAPDFSHPENDLINDMFVRLVANSFSNNDDRYAPPAKAKTLARVLRYIDANLLDPSLTPALVAQKNGLSLRYLHLLFSQSPHTFSSYVNEKRIALIQEELRDRSVDGATLTQIAMHHGFSSGAQLSRVFKRITGQTPRSFRQTASDESGNTPTANT